MLTVVVFKYVFPNSNTNVTSTMQNKTYFEHNNYCSCHTIMKRKIELNNKKTKIICRELFKSYYK